MKNINIDKNSICVLILSCLLFSSCSEEFIEVAPEDFLTSANFYGTEDDFTQAIFGAYSAVRGIVNDGWIMGEMRSDNTHYNYKANDRGLQNLYMEDIDAFLVTPENFEVAEKYNNAYEGISRTNAILDRIGNADFESVARNTIEGEASFLRAFFYYELVQFYGGVPLHLSEVTSESEAFLPRSSRQEVYEQIIADAEMAVALLPERNQTEAGRVSKAAAHTLLGYVFMSLERYSDAENQLKAVTEMGYELVENYADIFSTENENHAESIFEVQYMEGNQGQQSNWTYEFIPALPNTEVITGVVGNNQLIGGWNTPTEDLINSYETGDERKEASIAEGYFNEEGVFVEQPFIIKYLNPHSIYNNTDDNWPVYRYADVLLLLAQSLNEQGKSSEALPYLNMVRNRAGLDGIEITDQNALRLAIAHERRVELAFENKRWLDLVRTERAIEVMNEHGAEMKDKYAYLPDEAYQVDENDLVFPIPTNEILINPQLEQNPGYE